MLRTCRQCKKSSTVEPIRSAMTRWFNCPDHPNCINKDYWKKFANDAGTPYARRFKGNNLRPLIVYIGSIVLQLKYAHVAQRQRHWS